MEETSEKLDGDSKPQSREIPDAANPDLTTPVTRLNWRDLVEPTANVDDDNDVSPNDRILWDNKPGASYGPGLSPMLGRRGKKRARSSSPTSSPSTDQANAPTVNIKRLANALKSPHPDPTLELWDRFSLNSPASQKTPLGVSNPALAQLMVSSSPRPMREPASQRGVSSLRRAVSCGQSWPKKRKVEKAKPNSQGSKGQRDLEAASKSSLVSALLDTVTSSIQEESSDDARQVADSPSPKKRDTPATPTHIRAVPCTAAGEEITDSLSDYGDDDFDDDTLIELEANIETAASTQHEPAVKAPAPRALQTVQSHKGVTSQDEFGDLDDELFEDAHDILSQQPEHSLNPTTAHKAQQPAVEDEFDDDFGADIDFEAVELAATQAHQQATKPTSTVCLNGIPSGTIH